MALHQARLDSLLPDNLLLGFIKHDLLMSPATLVGTLFGVPFFCVHHHGTKCCVTASSLHKDSRVGLTARLSEWCILGSFRTWDIPKQQFNDRHLQTLLDPHRQTA